MRHGEWFLERQRLPGGDHSRDLPEGFSERAEQPPDFPEYARKLSIKDGCAMQFDGKDNYHQVSEWKGKTVPREQDKQQARLSCHTHATLLPRTRHSPATHAPLSCHTRQALRVMEAGLEAKHRALLEIAERAEWCAPQFDAAERVYRQIQKEYTPAKESYSDSY
eukprot:5143274-Prymnesium_polylepis.1